MNHLSKSKHHALWQSRWIIAGRRYRAFRAIVLLGLAGLALAGLAARAHNRPSRPVPVSTALLTPEPVNSSSLLKPPALAAQSAASKALEVELVTIHREGMYPKEMNLHKTRFLLAVDNRSETRVITLQLDRAGGGGRVDGALVPLEKLDWRTVVDVAPGSYVLSEANHPEWKCQITVSAN
jgi:hypothetical protein